jgi:hypothetical protein
MPRRPTLLLVFLALVALWSLPLQSVFAQDNPATPTPDAAAGAASATPPPEGISAPQPDAWLRDVVEIRGTAFSAWELSFSFAKNPTDTWFTLASSDQPVSDGLLAAWDTNSISDGLYVLRLRIAGVNGPQDALLNVRVANQLPDPTETGLPTLTPAPVLIGTAAPVEDSAPVGEATSLPPVLPVVTQPALPPNPAVLNPRDVFVNLGKGALGALVVFAFSGLVLFLRRR